MEPVSPSPQLKPSENSVSDSSFCSCDAEIDPKKKRSISESFKQHFHNDKRQKELDKREEIRHFAVAEKQNEELVQNQIENCQLQVKMIFIHFAFNSGELHEMFKNFHSQFFESFEVDRAQVMTLFEYMSENRQIGQKMMLSHILPIMGIIQDDMLADFLNVIGDKAYHNFNLSE